jgi:peptidoglycan hydrolase CwlO-like protein
MCDRTRYKKIIIWLIAALCLPSAASNIASSEVKPITEAQERIKGISEEEQKVLQQLFTLSQQIEESERDKARLAGEIEELNARINELDESIKDREKEYEHKLDLLEKVLLSYQKGGPASYLEILFSARDFSSFLKSINLIRDISRNTGELLAAIKEEGKKLAEEKELLAQEVTALEDTQKKLEISISELAELKKEQETYLASLEDEKGNYEEHLRSLELMWNDLKSMFSGVVDEFTSIIREGRFTIDDLNLSIGFSSVKGSISDETFNRIVRENSTLPETVFHFHKGYSVIEVPEKSLVLEGSFVKSGDAGVLFEVKSGSFYGMPLEEESIRELFKEGPIYIDFEAVAGDMVTIDIVLDKVETREGYLDFTVDTGFWF